MKDKYYKTYHERRKTRLYRCKECKKQFCQTKLRQTMYCSDECRNKRVAKKTKFFRNTPLGKMLGYSYVTKRMIKKYDNEKLTLRYNQLLIRLYLIEKEIVKRRIEC